MPPPPKKTRVSQLKGLKLYNFLLKRLGEQNAKKPKKQQLGITSRRNLVSKVLYPKFNGAAKVTATEISKDINAIITKLPPAEICNPLYLPEAFIVFVEYYEIDNHIRTVLPDCINVRVNAGTFGATKIFNTNNYSYYGNGVRKIIENIRKALADNKSGIAYFNGTPKLIKGKPNNQKPENYFVDYVLVINDVAEADDTPVDVQLPKKEVRKQEQVLDFISEKFSILEKDRRKRRRKAKREAQKKEAQKPAARRKKLNDQIRKAINSLKELLRDKLITKEQFEEQKKALLALKNKP